MRRIMIMVGIGVLAAVLLGAGAYAFGGGGGGSAGDRPAAKSGSGASEPPGPGVPPSATESTEPAGSGGPVAANGPAAPAWVAPTPTPLKTKAPEPANKGGCPQGEKQREVETVLVAIGGYGPVTVDGVQSAPDCAAITKFQQRFGISPANGRAGRTTADVARRIAASHTAEVRAKCRGGGLTVCIDLTLQTIWVIRNGAVAWGPSVVRTGFRGFSTPAGTYKISFRNIKEWSNPYEVWMPYWQRFNGGIGLHETTTYLHNGAIGSHGCVNLLRADARALWNLLGIGTTVHTFGRRPNT